MSGTTAHHYTVDEAMIYFEHVVKIEYLNYLQIQYPDYTFDVLGFGSHEGITRPTNATAILAAYGVNLIVSPTRSKRFIENYSLDSAKLYFWYSGKDLPLTYHLAMNPAGTAADYHMCGHCSRQVQCCK